VCGQRSQILLAFGSLSANEVFLDLWRDWQGREREREVMHTIRSTQSYCTRLHRLLSCLSGQTNPVCGLFAGRDGEGGGGRGEVDDRGERGRG
jgi:hypothetical protein